MTDLFKTQNSPITKGTPSYTAKDIEVLEGLEPVRKRPGMYIGGTDEKSLHHLAAEILDNAMDEAVARHATQIQFSLDANGYVTVMDNGRGIPVDPHPKYKDKSALEVILTTLHSGGKFSQTAYKTSGGLHGVGLSVVNALSDHLVVEIGRDGHMWRQEYSKGKPQTLLTPMNPSDLLPNFSKGTRISFHPDPEIFGEKSHFKPALLYQLVKSKAYLYGGVKILWQVDPTLIHDEIPARDTIQFKNGLLDYLQETLADKETLVPEPFYGTLDFPDDQGRIEWALSWTTEVDSFLKSYCNTIPTPLGGTHENGFRLAITKGIKNFGDLSKNKKAGQITSDDVFQNAVGVISVFVSDPQFQGQTKEKLVSQGVSKLVESALKDHFDHWLSGHPEMAQGILEAVIESMEDRLRQKAKKENSRKSATNRLRLPGKLTDCVRDGAVGTELFLVEGDSAGGSAKQARDRETQAVLPLRGKILNVASATMDKMLGNQEIKDLTLALGCHMGKDFSLKDLRYERVVIMTDADVDGAHIASLLMTFFFQQMHPLIDHGHLYLAQPPLYRISQGGATFYAKDDAEKDRLMKTIPGNKGKIEVSRFKGLGEMSSGQLKSTTMDPKNRTLIRVKLPQENLGVENIRAFVDELMGRHAESRYTYIQKNAQFVKELDI